MIGSGHSEPEEGRETVSGDNDQEEREKDVTFNLNLINLANLEEFLF